MRVLARLSIRVLYLSFLLAAAVRAQAPLPEDRGVAGLRLALLRLETTASVLHLTAHPDDEDGALLTTLARGQGARVMLLSLTRGEGGANLISPHFFEALGVLRTLEMLEVGRRYGVEQFFTRAVDYGFSKNIDEALASWAGADEVLRDAVRVVRRERPDVIAARFRGDPRDGHGHHMLAGVIAERVFAAAADPARFPEQAAEGLAPWQARKLYVPASRSDPAETRRVSIATGVYDPLLGRSYAQLGREAYGLHRSQGMSGRSAPAGVQESAYRLARAADPAHAPEREESIFSGLDISIAGIAARAGKDPPAWLAAGLREVAAAARQANEAFDARAPEKCTPHLARGLTGNRKLVREVEASALPAPARDEVLRLLRRKQSEFADALAKALGLDLAAVLELEGAAGRPSAGPGLTSHTVTPGESVQVAVRLVNRSGIEVRPVSAALRAPAGWQAAPEPLDLKPLGYNEALTAKFAVQVAADAPPTRPHWRRDSVRETFYAVEPPELGTYPLPPPPLAATVQVAVLGETIALVEPVRAEFLDPVHGPVREPVAVVPAIGVEFSSEHGFLPLGGREYRLGIKVRSGSRKPVEGAVRLQLPAGWTAEPGSRPFALGRQGEEASFVFVLTAPADLRAAEYAVSAVAAAGGREYAEGFTLITARDLGRFHLYRPARHSIHAVDVKVAPDLKLAYVMGSGDDVPAAMEYLGVRPEMLGPEDLASADLSRYDAVLIGIRAYAVRPELVTHNARLLDYVQEGGVLIVQYQTPEFDRNYGPYPYTMTWGAEEVSEEDSPVEVLAPENPIFTAPNRITPADFQGWVEQRGSKFWKTWDSRYLPLLASHDRNQEPQQGGMLVARHGKGAYVYSAYAWYRQLPFGVPGALRIFANLISLRRTLGETPAAGSAWRSLPAAEPRGERQHTGSYTVQDPAGSGWKRPASRLDEKAATGRKRARVIVLIYDPVLEAEGGKTLVERFQLHDPVEYSRILANVIREASWGYINYELADFIRVDGFPVKTDGFRYTDESYLEARRTEKWHGTPASYRKMFEEHGLLERFRREGITELWVWGASGMAIDEFAGFIPNRYARFAPTDNPWFYRPYDIPEELGRTTWVMGFNYEVGPDNMVHSYTHRVESMAALALAAGVWDTHARRDPWNAFSWLEVDHPGSPSQVGNCHVPPNGQDGYDYDNKRRVLSWADRWANFPDLRGEPRLVSSAEWGNNQFGYQKWILEHVPRFPGATEHGYNNWWVYIANTDEDLPELERPDPSRFILPADMPPPGPKGEK